MDGSSFSARRHSAARPQQYQKLQAIQHNDLKRQQSMTEQVSKQISPRNLEQVSTMIALGEPKADEQLRTNYR